MRNLISNVKKKLRSHPSRKFSFSPISLFQSFVVDLKSYAMGKLEQPTNTTGQFLTE